QRTDIAGEIIPLRPLTLAELLDCALELLRRNARGLLAASAILAVAEQLLLLPVRLAAGPIPPYFDPLDDDLGAVWLVVIDRLGPFAALGRSLRMVARGRWRPGGIRMLGYLAWYAIRVALALGGTAALGLVVHLPGRVWPAVVAVGAWTLVNAVAYAALGC